MGNAERCCNGGDIEGNKEWGGGSPKTNKKGHLQINKGLGLPRGDGKWAQLYSHNFIWSSLPSNAPHTPNRLVSSFPLKGVSAYVSYVFKSPNKNVIALDCLGGSVG